MRNPTSAPVRATRRTRLPASAALREQVKTLAARIEMLEDYIRSVQKTRVNDATSSEYAWFVNAFRRRVAGAVPARARILVVSRGDPALLDIAERDTAHFPQDDTAQYRGFYPADDTAAIAHLEALRQSGYDALVFPAPAAWWLDHYREFRQHLERYYTETLCDELCRVFDLRRHSAPPGTDHARLERVFAEAQQRLGRAPDVLDWTADANLRRRFPHLAVAHSKAAARLPHLDNSIDVVVVDSEKAVAVREARRVATTAVVLIRDNGVADTEWLTARQRMPVEEHGLEDTSVCVAEGVSVMPGAGAVLAATLQRFPEAGAVGGRILDFDGCLYHAGGAMGVDGTLSNRGEGNWHPDDPRYTFVHPVDYCSSLFMVTPRRAFDDVGGFDASIPDRALRDADFCLRLQQRGYVVLYQPEAVAVCSAALTTALREPAGPDRRAWQRTLARRWKPMLLSRLPLGDVWG